MLKNGSYSAHELQRIKVMQSSLFGIWSDFDETIELKIFPSADGARIKIWTVNDFVSIARISLFCGLNGLPKRANWQGFDLITSLSRSENNCFVNGIVHMPNIKRRNFADLKIYSPSQADLNFFYCEDREGDVMIESGTLALRHIRSTDLFRWDSIP